VTPEQIGEYLEHQGATNEEIDEFLEHFGVKGMQWGKRKATSNGVKKDTRLTAGNALASFGVGTAAGLASRRFTTNRAVPLATAFAGAAVTSKLLEHRGQEHTSSVKKKKEPMSAGERVAVGILGGALVAQGALTLAAIKMGK
jgi:hypothetical protein